MTAPDARRGPWPLPEDWPAAESDPAGLRSEIAFLRAQTAHQAGTIGRMSEEYEQLADLYNRERAATAAMGAELAAWHARTWIAIEAQSLQSLF